MYTRNRYQHHYYESFSKFHVHEKILSSRWLHIIDGYTNGCLSELKFVIQGMVAIHKFKVCTSLQYM